MSHRQVRLDLDTEQIVETERARAGGSLSAATNRLLRAHGQIAPGVQRAPTVAAKPAEAVRAPARSTAPRRGSQAVTQARTGVCPHPLLRRIGDFCAACGNHV